MKEDRISSLDMKALESNLPFYLWNDIEYIKKEYCLDCSTAEFEVDLREALKCHEITKYQKEYLERKYLKGANEEELRLWFEQTFNS